MKSIKNHILIIVFGFLPFFCHALTLSEEGDEAYENRDYQKAIELYKKSIEDEGSSSAILYNLGNAYFRCDSLGKAILNYERALRLDPTNENALYNLEIANNKIVDKQVDSSEDKNAKSTIDKYLKDTISDYDAVSADVHPNLYAWIALGAFILTIVLVGFFILSQSIRIRKICFFISIATFIASVIFIIIAVKSTNSIARKDMAIIIAKESQLSTAPAIPLNSSEKAVLLHEGTKLQIIDSVATPNDPVIKKWYEVRIDGNVSAWISGNDIEII